MNALRLTWWVIEHQMSLTAVATSRMLRPRAVLPPGRDEGSVWPGPGFRGSAGYLAEEPCRDRGGVSHGAVGNRAGPCRLRSARTRRTVAPQEGARTPQWGRLARPARAAALPHPHRPRPSPSPHGRVDRHSPHGAGLAHRGPHAVAKEPCRDRAGLPHGASRERRPLPTGPPSTAAPAWRSTPSTSPR